MTEHGSAGDNDARTLLAESVDLPYGEARTLVVERALRDAEREGDHDLVFDVLAELISVYRYGGEPAKSLSSFVRLVSEFDAGHGEPVDWAAHSVRWYYKWAISLLLDYPQFDLDRINSVLDEMERRYTEDGQSLHAVYQMRYRVAQHLDDFDGADHWYAKWVASPADENADCSGCNPNSRVGYLVWRDRDEDAIELATPVLQGRLTCREQPHSMLTTLLMAYVRTGRLEQAVDAHRRAYRVHRGELSDLGQIGRHVRFCALTGNEPRGLEIVQRHLSWLDRFTTPDDTADFATDVAVLLRRLPRDTMVHTSGVRIGGEHRELSDRTEAGELADRLVEWAYEIGARFDERNGNTSYTDGITQDLAREPLVDNLPLSPHNRPTRGSRTAGSVGEPSAGGGEVSGSAGLSGTTEASGSSSALDQWAVTESDPVALLDLAEEHWSNGRSSRAIACWQRFDEVVPTDPAGEPDVDPLLRGRRAEGDGLRQVDRSDLKAGRESFERAQQLFADAAADDRWWAVDGLLAQLMVDAGDPEAAIVRLGTVVDRLRELGVPRLRRVAELRLAHVQLLTGRFDEARQLLRDESGPDDPALRSRTSFLQAQLSASSGELSEALGWLENALTDVRSIGSERTYPLVGMRAALLMDLSDNGAVPDAEVRPALDDWVAVAAEPQERASAYAGRGRWLLRHGDPEAAMPDLAETVAELTAGGAWIAECWIDLGEAYLRSKRPMDAAEVLEEAIGRILSDQQTGVEPTPDPDQPADPDLAFETRRARYLLARAKIALSEQASAISDLEAVADAETRVGDRRRAGAVTEELGDLLSDEDRDSEAEDRFREAAAHFASVDDLHGEVRCTRREALAIFYGPNEEMALGVFERARTLLRERGDELDPTTVMAEHAMVDLGQAKTLSFLDRDAEAHPFARSALEGFRKLGDEQGAEAARRLLDGEPETWGDDEDEDRTEET